MISGRRVGAIELVKRGEGSALQERFFIVSQLRTEKKKGVVIDVYRYERRETKLKEFMSNGYNSFELI